MAGAVLRPRVSAADTIIRGALGCPGFEHTKYMLYFTSEMPAWIYELKTYFYTQLPCTHSSNHLQNTKCHFIIALKHFTGLLLHVSRVMWRLGNPSFFFSFVFAALKLDTYAFQTTQTSWQYITSLFLNGITPLFLFFFFFIRKKVALVRLHYCM